MGCLNSGQGFRHWFGNIHLSGPCSRSCYFCIGQHMLAVDKFNVLDTWPLPGWDGFLEECEKHPIETVYVTGTNTDPLLYRHLHWLTLAIRAAGYSPGIRTNGIGWTREVGTWFDKGSLTVCSLDEAVNRRMMGGPPPKVEQVLRDMPDLKINIVLGPENCEDVLNTLRRLAMIGIKRANLREPYGQPHVGDPLAERAKEYGIQPDMTLGMPTYQCYGMRVTYWDVHYVEVESVNLYANGHTSVEYPITRGVDFDRGEVLPQEHFPGGRVQEQWQN
jgi:hypothetical protein